MVYRSTPKMEERKEARRLSLLNAAIRCFGRKGYHATTVPKIVRTAGTSVGNFYFYFRNKEDVFAAALDLLGRQIAAALNEAIAAAPPEVLAQMRAAIKALVRFLAENPQKARILIVETSGLGPQLEAVRRRVIESHTRSVEMALRRLEGKLPPLDADVVAACWVGAVYEAVYRWLARPPEDRVPAEHLGDAIADFNLRGIGAPRID